MHSIYKVISKRSERRAKAGFTVTNPYPDSYKEADAIIAAEIAYFGIQNLNDHINPLVFPKDAFHQELKIWLEKVTLLNDPVWKYGVDIAYDPERLKAAADICYKNCMNYINDLRQRYWYWKPANIMYNIDCIL